uniref:Leucine-rich repeat LGI family member 3 n=1 Tax=Callorhinchus milii TaxID=7868 RepID=V9KPH9_CALMI
MNQQPGMMYVGEKGSGRRSPLAVGLMFWIFCLGVLVEAKRPPKCPLTCSCTKDSAFCVGSKAIPRTFPMDVISLTFVSAKFTLIPAGAFSHLPTLQFLLLNANQFTYIKDNAFSGLSHLQYLFIENNEIQSLSKDTFQGLRALTHLSLENNKLQALPRGIFKDLRILTDLDLRGNAFHCDCKVKWLIEWLRTTNASIAPVQCASPAKYQGHKVSQLPIKDFACITTEFILYQTLPFQSISVEPFGFADDLYVTFAQTNGGNCTFLKWDHIEMVFKRSENISARAAVYCKPLVIDGQLFVIVAQLFGGSHVYRWDDFGGKFIRIQDIDATKTRKPNDIETFQIEGEWYFVIADSSKAGATTIYKWNTNGFYSHQSLHVWHRDTDVEFVQLDGKPKLIISSSTQTPVVYQWNWARKQFVYQMEIPGMLNVHAVKHFRIKRDMYLCLTQFIGDSKVVKWENHKVTTNQVLPSRGTMIAQPLQIIQWHYLVLGSDFSLSTIYLWDAGEMKFARFQDWNLRAPRSFKLVSIDNFDLVLASSFKGNTVIYKHNIVDLSA